MKELFYYIKRLDIRALLFEKTDNAFIQFFRYIFVGGISFVTDMVLLLILERLMISSGVSDRIAYLIATPVSFVISFIVNYALSKKFIFTEEKENKVFEFIVYMIIAVTGLALTEVLMYLFKGVFGLSTWLAKGIAAALVLIWNFAARKLILYRTPKKTAQDI